jgi:hypothetical protein
MPNNQEANAPVMPRSVGRCNLTGPAVILIVISQ